MNIRSVASESLYDMQDGICWMILYKLGRSWQYSLVWPDVNDNSYPVITDEDEKDRAEEILQADENAVILNGYYLNLGPFEGMTVGTLSDGLAWQYKSQMSLLRNCLEV